MSYSSIILNIRLNLAYALDIFIDKSLDLDVRMLALSKLVSVGIINFHYLYLYHIKDFHIFTPSFNLCFNILNSLGSYEPVLLACIALKYDNIFFKFKGNNHKLYYEYACKFNNVKIMDYEINENGFKKIESVFDYTLFVTGT